jgi:hypothetical protein
MSSEDGLPHGGIAQPGAGLEHSSCPRTNGNFRETAGVCGNKARGSAAANLPESFEQNLHIPKLSAKVFEFVEVTRLSS